MRPALKTGLLAAWRDRDTLQIGIDPRRAVALTGMAGAAGLLGLLDGSRDRAQVLAAAGDLGVPESAADRVLSLLAAAGALHDVPAGGCVLTSGAARRRLAPELATAALARGDSDGGARTLARRRAAAIWVHGTIGAGLSLAALLSGAGIGRVRTSGPAAPAGPAELPPGLATGRAHRGQPRPDLVVLAGPCHPELPAALVTACVPHLALAAGEAIGTVGPLVIPGRSACLRCLDLARADRDPAWPLILAQVAGRVPDPPACDTVLAAAVASQAAAQVLEFVDRAAPASAVTSATLELVLPGWQWRRRSWQPHSRCGCGSRTSS